MTNDSADRRGLDAAGQDPVTETGWARVERRDEEHGRGRIVRRLVEPVGAAAFAEHIAALREVEDPRVVIPVAADPEAGVVERPRIEGPTLRERLADGPFAPRDAVELLRDLAAALGSLHGVGVAHLSLCPEKIRLSAEGLRVVDAGTPALSRRKPVAARSDRLAWLAPEQRDGGEGDAASDVYAFGVVMFELLTGARPEGGEVPSDRVPELPTWTDALFQRCYAPRSRRLENGAAVLAWLDEQLGLGHHRSESERAVRAGAMVGSEVEDTGGGAPVKITPAAAAAEAPGFGDALLSVDSTRPRRSTLDRVRRAATFVGAMLVFAGACLFVLERHKEITRVTITSGYDPVVVGMPGGQPTPAHSGLFGEAQSLYLTGRYRPALAKVAELNELEPTRADAWRLRGQIQAELGQMAAARTSLDRAIELDPSDADAWLARGDACHFSGRLDEAVRDFRIFLDLRPDSPKAPLVRGWVAELIAAGAR